MSDANAQQNLRAYVELLSDVTARGAGDRDKRKVCVYLPPEVLAEMRAEAKRQGQSLSWIAQQAIRLSGERRSARRFLGDAHFRNRNPTVYLPSEMLDEMHAEAKRQGRPISWIVRKAFQIAGWAAREDGARP